MNDENEEDEMDKIFFPRQPHKKRRKIIRVENVSNGEEINEKQENGSEIADDMTFPKYITDYKGQKLLVHWLQSEQDEQNCNEQPSQDCDEKTVENAETNESNGMLVIDTSHKEESNCTTESKLKIQPEDLCANVSSINGKDSSDVTNTDESINIPLNESDSKDVQKEIKDNLLDKKDNISISENESISNENCNNADNAEETVSSDLQNAPIEEKD